MKQTSQSESWERRPVGLFEPYECERVSVCTCARVHACVNV